MSKELTISEQIDLADRYAQALITPDAYRKRSADILIAIALGQSIGLAPVQSMYEINVIKGKPAMSAALIAAQVRKAGHTLRVEVDETPGKECAKCTIIRRDDPEYPFVSTRDRAWAQRMGLLNNLNYSKQPATMLKKRAITDCARDACSEVLCGIDYTPDEMSDFDDVEATVEEHEEPTRTPDIVEAEIVEEKPEPPKPDVITISQQETIIKMLYEAGIYSRNDAIDYMRKIVFHNQPARPTMEEAELVIENRESVIKDARAWVREQSTKRTQQQAEQEQAEQQEKEQ